MLTLNYIEAIVVFDGAGVPGGGANVRARAPVACSGALVSLHQPSVSRTLPLTITTNVNTILAR